MDSETVMRLVKRTLIFPGINVQILITIALLSHQQGKKKKNPTNFCKYEKTQVKQEQYYAFLTYN